ncbi:MAG: hypothetical protein FWE37_05625 [Spirochaetaceae bacterium]|nr:hypothetical protein [Spirochaetaceae bacterium]
MLNDNIINEPIGVNFDQETISGREGFNLVKNNIVPESYNLSTISSIILPRYIDNYNESINLVDILASNLKIEYHDLFLNVIKREELEDGFVAKSELVYQEIVLKYGYVLSVDFINDICMWGWQNNDIKVLLSVLKIIANITSEYEIEKFIHIAMYLFGHKNLEIADSAIFCFEKWGRKKDAELLKKFREPKEDWLKDYFHKTIAYLENL